MEHQGDSPQRSPTSIDMGGGAAQEMCIPIPRWTGIRPEVIGTQQMGILMVVGVQKMRDRPVADALDIQVTTWILRLDTLLNGKLQKDSGRGID